MALSPENYFRYLVVSDREIGWGLYVTNAGHARIPAKSPYPPAGHPESHAFRWEQGRRLPEYQILYISEGEGEFEVEGGQTFELHPGNAVILFPNVWHRYRPNPTVGWNEYWVSINGPVIDRWVEHQFISPKQPLYRLEDGRTVVDSYSRILELIHLETPGYTQLIASEASSLIASILATQRTEQAGDKALKMIRDAKRCLENQVEEIPEMKRLAASLHYSTSHFYRLFKEHTGLTPYQYHLQIRINRACFLLRNTDLPIKQIAARLHFSSPYHFSKMFKARLGVSPTKWRNP